MSAASLITFVEDESTFTVPVNLTAQEHQLLASALASASESTSTLYPASASANTPILFYQLTSNITITLQAYR